MKRIHFFVIGVVLFGLLSLGSYSAAKTSQRQAAPVKSEHVILDPDYGTAQYLMGRFPTDRSLALEQAAYRFIDSRPDAFDMAFAEQELELIKTQSDTFGKTHLRFQQKYRGLDVWSRQTIVHFDSDQTIYMVGGQTIPTPGISTSPMIDEVSAEQYAIASLNPDSLPGDVRASIELVVLPHEGEVYLAHLTTITSPTTAEIRWRVFVDARTGQVLHKFNDIHYDGPDTGSGLDTRDSVRVFPIYLEGTDYKLWNTENLAMIFTYSNYYGGGPLSTDPDGDKVWDDNIAQKAEVAGHYYADLTVKYFWDTFGRNSYDDLGGDVIVNVHVPGIGINAFWDGHAMNFSDGDGVNLLPISGSRDAVAHEFAHGVTEYTAGLIYQYQSGAINESMSDVFGAMVDRDDWLIGEEVGLHPSIYLRDMSNPGARGHPGHMDQYINHPIGVDNGGVHINSGIGNHCYYWAATLMGKDKAEQIWYRALTTYLTPSSGYYFFAGAIKRSAEDLYGNPSAELDATIQALEIVGLNTAYASIESIDKSVAVGETDQSAIWIYNPGPTTLEITAIAPTVFGVSLVEGPGYQMSVSAGDSTEFTVNFDASSLELCDAGVTKDSLRIKAVGNITTQIKIPLAYTVGFVSTSYSTETVAPACVDVSFDNRNTIFDFTRDGSDVLWSSSPLIGMINGSDTSVYHTLHGENGFPVVDEIITDSNSSSYRFISHDGQVHGRTTLEYDPGSIDSCGFALLEYDLYTPCDTPLTIRLGFIADFQVTVGAANRVAFDNDLNLIYTMDEHDTRAAGIMLLDHEPANMQALVGIVSIWSGQFNNAMIMDLLNETTNSTGATLSDYTQLITYGDVHLSQTEETRIRFALLYSNTGSAGLEEIAYKAIDFASFCCSGIRGNVNSDPEDKVNISDVTYLTAYLFGIPSGPEPQCIQEGNANADPDDKVNIADVTYLTSYLFGIPAGPAPPSCP